MSLQLVDVRKTYYAPDGSAVPVVDVSEFTLADGQQAALVGTSGGGKTTLLHLIAGILTPDSGHIYFTLPPSSASGTQAPGDVLPYARSGDEPFDIPAMSEAERDIFRGRHMGYIFQTHHLLGGFTALENVLLGMSFTGRRHDRAWGEHLLVEVGLGERLQYKPAKLSVGQQQRVAVARALANRPSLVLADEPTGALDVKNAQSVLELIQRLCTEVNASLLLVTHDPSVAGKLPVTVSLADLNRSARSTGSAEGA